MSQESTHTHVSAANPDTVKSPRRDLKQTHLQKSLDDKLDSEIVCFNGFISVVLLQKLSHRFGSSANGISLETSRGKKMMSGSLEETSFTE